MYNNKVNHLNTKQGRRRVMSEKQQANIGDWDNDFPADEQKGSKQQDRKSLPFMKFEKPGDYTIRLVGAHVKFRRHWKPFSDRIISHDTYEGKDPAWNAGFFPRETFAIHVIDRADGKLKILEKGRSLFKQFARYKIVNETNPADKVGPDWVITVEWPKGNKRQAKYSAVAKSKTNELSKEEIEMFKADKIPLNELYAATPLAKIQELWDALPDEAKIPQKKEDDDSEEGVKHEKVEKTESKPKVIEEQIVAESDDLFGDDDNDSF
jgi:hypothetical protein